jgi:hypothetical protein
VKYPHKPGRPVRVIAIGHVDPGTTTLDMIVDLKGFPERLWVNEAADIDVDYDLINKVAREDKGSR